MEKLKIYFRYCYGIKKLDHGFDFSKNKNKNPNHIHRTYTIYAPNGSMKTSFAKTFKNCAEGKRTIDEVFPDRKTTRNILSDGREIKRENIFVIESYNEKDDTSKNMSKLLVNAALKKQYEDIYKDINDIKTDLFKELKKLSGLNDKKSNIELDIRNAFANKDFFNIILELEDSVVKTDDPPFNVHDIKYKTIFNPDAVNFLETDDVRKSIKEYVDKYDELIGESPYLKKDFNLYNAKNIRQELDKNNFFKVGHSVNLFDGKNKKEFLTPDELKKAIEDEIKRVVDNEDLKKRFDNIEEKINKNKQLRELGDCLLNNQYIVPELMNLDAFKEKLWKFYFVEQKSLFLKLIEKYKEGRQEIENITKRAEEQKTAWQDAINIFNNRFTYLPFSLHIENKADVMLKDTVPSIAYNYNDNGEQRCYRDNGSGELDELLDILSSGERRANYILNIIFEVEVRKKDNKETLFIIDDIADSFDYKNKYAVIEYLQDISKVKAFSMIILTHNFDFFRTIESRGIVPYDQCLIVIKNDTGIKLEKAEGWKNPFINDWKENLNDSKKLIASIPFVRNIIEYTQGTSCHANVTKKDIKRPSSQLEIFCDSEYTENQECSIKRHGTENGYLLLTSVLHFKDSTEKLKTKDLTLRNIKTVFKKYLPSWEFPNKYTLNQKVLKLIFETADECAKENNEGINLEHKIVLSIAIRLKAELFMRRKISGWEDASSNQTKRLLEMYKNEFENTGEDENKNIEILEQVCLITPANIHLNAFMYEPIIDMGYGELTSLYDKVLKLCESVGIT